jgi:potassium-transporting ATPase KdpC subunit
VKTRIWLPSLALLVVMTVLTGVAYPLLVTGVAVLAFPARAGGSLVTHDGKVVGSALIGQGFASDRYFQGRPSATGPMPYNAGASSGGNLSPRGDVLKGQVAERVAALQKANPDARGLIPADLVTGSGSGLDPHITKAAALYQVPRVARERGGIEQARLVRLVDRMTEGRQLGFLGEARVNVLGLNLALDEGRF